MHLLKITDPQHSLLPFVRDLYESAFPFHERRYWQSVIHSLTCNDMQLFVLEDSGPVGFVIVWLIEGFCYIEHFAISPSERGKQYGSKVMDELLSRFNQKIILEVEPEHDEDSKRRISFYQKKGLQPIPYAYMQPPYRKGEEQHSMQLMSIPAITDRNQFIELAALIKITVYEQFYH